MVCWKGREEQERAHAVRPVHQGLLGSEFEITVGASLVGVLKSGRHKAYLYRCVSPDSQALEPGNERRKGRPAVAQE